MVATTDAAEAKIYFSADANGENIHCKNFKLSSRTLSSSKFTSGLVASIII